MRRLSNCGSWTQSLRGMWDLPRPGLEPVSPALIGRLSTTAPPGKPPDSLLTKSFSPLMQKEDTNRHRKVKCPCLPTSIIQAPDMTQTCCQDFTPEFWSKGFIPSLNVILPTTCPPHNFYRDKKEYQDQWVRSRWGGVLRERVRDQAHSHHFSPKCNLLETFSVAILKKLGLCDCCQYRGETYKPWNQRNLDKNPNLPLTSFAFSNKLFSSLNHLYRD